jgi:hypothetical protein
VVIVVLHCLSARSGRSTDNRIWIGGEWNDSVASGCLNACMTGGKGAN